MQYPLTLAFTCECRQVQPAYTQWLATHGRYQVGSSHWRPKDLSQTPAVVVLDQLAQIQAADVVVPAVGWPCWTISWLCGAAGPFAEVAAAIVEHAFGRQLVDGILLFGHDCHVPANTQVLYETGVYLQMELEDRLLLGLPLRSILWEERNGMFIPHEIDFTVRE